MLKKFKVLFVIASFAITLSLMSNTYSRYVASSQGNLEVEFAKWQLSVNNTDITNSTSSSIDFEPTIEKNENIAENKIAPTSVGYFDIEIDPTNVDVSFKYSIELNIDNANIPDLMITRYAYLPDNYSEGDALNYIYLNNENLSSIEQELKYASNGKFNINENNNIKSIENIKIRVFFEWIEGTVEYTNDETGIIENTIEETMSNADDSAIGINAVNEESNSFKLSATIKFEQIIA